MIARPTIRISEPPEIDAIRIEVRVGKWKIVRHVAKKWRFETRKILGLIPIASRVRDRALEAEMVRREILFAAREIQIHAEREGV